jgi:hypothetical protein
VWLSVSAAVIAALGLIGFLVYYTSRPAIEMEGSESAAVPPTVISKPRAVDLGGVSIEFVPVPAGSFPMGSANGDRDEKPVHWVTISRPFHLGKYEVTQAQWQAVMGNNPSHFTGANLPVESVSWEDAQEFLRRLNARNDGYTYRLPSEAEWEYACRAGTTGEYAGELDALAWYGNNAGRRPVDAPALWRADQQNYMQQIVDNGNQTHPVGRLPRRLSSPGPAQPARQPLRSARRGGGEQAMSGQARELFWRTVQRIDLP